MHVVAFAPIVNHCLSCKRRLHEETISLNIEEPQYGRCGAVVRCVPTSFPIPVLAASTPVHIASPPSGLYQLIQQAPPHGRGERSGESSKGCLRTTYLMHFQPAPNDLRRPPYKIRRLCSLCRAVRCDRVLVTINWQRHKGRDSRLGGRQRSFVIRVASPRDSTNYGV